MSDLENKLANRIILGMVGHLANELCMIKAMNYVQLEILAKDKGLDMNKINKKIEQLHAEHNFQLQKISEDVIKKASNPDEPDSFLKDLI